MLNAVGARKIVITRTLVRSHQRKVNISLLRQLKLNLSQVNHNKTQSQPQFSKSQATQESQPSGSRPTKASWLRHAKACGPRPAKKLTQTQPSGSTPDKKLNTYSTKWIKNCCKKVKHNKTRKKCYIIRSYNHAKRNKECLKPYH